MHLGIRTPLNVYLQFNFVAELHICQAIVYYYKDLLENLVLMGTSLVI